MKKNTYELLEEEIQKATESIKVEQDVDKKSDLIGYKIDLEYSLALLKKCAEFEVKPKSIFHKVPTQKCSTPSSEYRLMEDQETEDRKFWSEADFGSREVRLHEGDVVIEV